MKRLQLILLALIAALVFNTVAVYALTALPDSAPTVISKKFYRNLLESDDRLLVVYANIPYTSTPPTPVTGTFIWELVNSDNVTIYGSTTGYAFSDSGYGYNVYSMYFEAADAVPWDPASSHILRLKGSPIEFTTPPVYDYPIASVDYSSETVAADVQEELALDILVIADDLDFQWGLTTDSLITDDDTGETLSTLGQAFFRGAIYGIHRLAPALFALTISNVDITDRTWTDAYVSDLDVQYAGTWVHTAKAAGGVLFGVSYDLTSLILLLAMCIGILIANIMLTNDHWNALVDIAFILVIGTKISLLGLGYLSLMAALAWVYIGIRLWGLGKS